MRRFFAIALCLFFSSSLISPLLALTAGPGANLPACCRRNGAHHCTGNMPMQDSAGATQLTLTPERCPSFPQLVNSAPHTQLATPAASLLSAELISSPALHRPTEPRAPVALDRSRHTRGPPALL